VHQSMQYELFAVAVHIGRSIFSGHYVAYAKRNGKVYNAINVSGIILTILLFIRLS
jgi:ubiquitin C-terminal hydrolase